MDHRRILDLLERVLLLELRIRIPLGVLMADPRNLREIFVSSAVPISHVSLLRLGELQLQR